MNFTIKDKAELEKLMNRIMKIYKTTSASVAPQEMASGNE